MRERPILYSPLMVQAKLAGLKTQTRRIIPESFNGCLTNGGPHPCPNEPIVFHPGEKYENPEDGSEIVIDYPQSRALFHCSTLNSEAKCRYGKKGDHLYGKETFFAYGYWESSLGFHGKPILHFVDLTLQSGLKYDYPDKMSYNHIQGRPLYQQGYYKRPSLFMPKEAARIWDEIIDIRVEALNNISENDAKAEGIEFFDDGQYRNYLSKKQNFYENAAQSAVESYKTLWESINGIGSWKIDPWVWVIETSPITEKGNLK